MTLNLKALYPQMGRLLETTRLKALVVGNVAEMTPAPAAAHDKMSQNGINEYRLGPPNDGKHLTLK